MRFMVFLAFYFYVSFGLKSCSFPSQVENVKQCLFFGYLIWSLNKLFSVKNGHQKYLIECSSLGSEILFLLRDMSKLIRGIFHNCLIETKRFCETVRFLALSLNVSFSLKTSSFPKKYGCQK
jgi:hypothetical protein